MILDAAGGAGLIAGAFIGKKYPKVIREWCWGILVAGIPIIYISWMLFTYATHVATPQKIKLADLQII